MGNPKPMTRLILTSALCVSFIALIGVGCATNRGTRIKGVDQYVKAVQAYNSGDRDRAVQNLVIATRANPDLIMARLMLGDLYREGGRYDDAVEQYEKLVLLDPYTWQNFYKLGVSYQFLQRLIEAASSYKKALNLNPDDPNSNMNLGLVNLYMGDADEAVRYCEKATLLDPRSAAAFSNLGVALDAKGEYGRAEAAYRKSLDIDPENTTTMLNLGTNLIAQNKGGEAVSILERVIAVGDTPLHRKRYGDALAKAGRYDEAIDQYQQALKHEPNYYPAMNEIGWSRIAEYRNNLELDDSKRDQAIEFWKQSLEINPEQPKIATALKEWTERAAAQ
jgi:tetratricopeptide (TPR) repeat protein